MSHRLLARAPCCGSMDSHVIYKFGDFSLDPANRELWRGDVEVPLPPARCSGADSA